MEYKDQQEAKDNTNENERDLDLAIFEKNLIEFNSLDESGKQLKQTSESETESGTCKCLYFKLEALIRNLNNQFQYQIECSENLKNVIEQCKRERDEEINERLRQYHAALCEKTSIANRLTRENDLIRTRLAECYQELSAAHRLNDQMRKKEYEIFRLRNENHDKDKQIQQYEHNLRELQSTANILLSYFHASRDKRQEVIPHLAALVGFTQEEYNTAIDALSTNNSNSSRERSDWLGANPAASGGGANPAASGGGANLARTTTQSETPIYNPNELFTELLIRYNDEEPPHGLQQPTAKFNNEKHLHRYDSTVGGGNHHLLRKPSLSASATPFINTTRLSLNEQSPAVVLPTLNAQQNSPIVNPPHTLSSSTTTSTKNRESSLAKLKNLLKF